MTQVREKVRRSCSASAPVCARVCLFIFFVLISISLSLLVGHCFITVQVLFITFFPAAQFIRFLHYRHERADERRIPAWFVFRSLPVEGLSEIRDRRLSQAGAEPRVSETEYPCEATRPLRVGLLSTRSTTAVRRKKR